MYQIGCARSQLVSLHEFKNMPTDAFYDFDADRQFMNLLKPMSIKTLLDVDAHFLKSQLLTKGFNDLTEIDCISETELPPIKENIYNRVYKKFSDCQFRHYDAALVYGRTNINFMTAFSELENMTDVVITFARYGSELEQYLSLKSNQLAKVHFVQTSSGVWIIFVRHNKPKDFAIYVVTHKELPAEHVKKLPEGYKVIHAGRTLAEDLGYIGDNTGDNISYLNPYMSEFSALYWMWKNTNHSIIGLAHYRRFLTESPDESFAYEKILTKERAERLLQDYDIIATVNFIDLTLFDATAATIKSYELAEFAHSIFRKHLVKNFPDYVEFFDKVLNSKVYNSYTMIITRKHILDSYCKWLFSFMIDACKELFQKLPPDSLTAWTKRYAAFYSERMESVWLMKNRLRTKELTRMFVDL